MKTTALTALTTALLVISTGPWVPAAANDGEGETIYARTYPGGRRLVVLKNEIPLKDVYPDGMPATVPSLRQPGTAAHAVYPEHAYVYSFIVQSAGAKPQLVGKTGCSTLHGEVERMQFVIYDVALYDDKLVVLYRTGQLVIADVAMLDSNTGTFLERESLSLERDPRAGGAGLLGGRVERSQTGEVSVVVVVYDRRGDIVNRRFRLKIKDGTRSWEPVNDN